VFPDGTAAERPFTIRDGRAFGPGVDDMKGGLLAGIYALRALRKLRTAARGTEAPHPNMVVYTPYEVARIIRRPDAHGDVNVLEVTGASADRRLLVALATLVFGSEP